MSAPAAADWTVASQFLGGAHRGNAAKTDNTGEQVTNVA
jgi:hypothetical protein